MSSDLKLRTLQTVEQWQERFQALQPRERMIISAGGLLLVLVALYTLVLAPLSRAVETRTQRIAQKQQDLSWMQSIAPQLSALVASQPNPGSSGESMVVLVANSATSSNISAALTGQTPDGPDGVRVRFEGVNFDALVVWLGALQRDYGIQITEAELNRVNAGQVNATLRLSRAAASGT